MMKLPGSIVNACLFRLCIVIRGPLRFLLSFIIFQQKTEKPAAAATSSPADLKDKKKERILDLSRYMDKMIRVKFSGGREASGFLKGYDPLLNIVLDNTVEFLRGKNCCKQLSNSKYLFNLPHIILDPEDPFKLSEETRHLGLVVCRGTAVVLICPADGMESIPNPFIQPE